MRSLGLNVDHVDRLTCCDIQLVPFHTTKAQVGANLRELDQADTLSLWVEYVKPS